MHPDTQHAVTLGINVKSIQFFVASGTAENPILIRYGLYMLE